MRTVEFFFDVGSPYSYLASTRIEAIVADCAATLRWRPMLVGAVFQATGNTPPMLVGQKIAWLVRDLERWSAYYGVPLRTLAPPATTLLPMRVLSALHDDDVAAATHRMYHAYWVDGRDLSSPTVLRDLVGAEAVARAAEQATKDRLRATTDEAVRRGVFGAPTVFVGDEMFFGNDRLPFVEQHLRSLR
jgi:2-hydroxychromene-2-carboxylate isomerase